MRYKVTILSVGDWQFDASEDFAIHADMQACSDALAMYVGDEYDEQKGAVRDKPSTLADLFAAFGYIYAGLARGNDFSFVYDGELFIVQVAA